MRISVVVCTYNGAAFVQEQLNSIGRQTVLPDEVVICDDNSKDETPKLLMQFASTAPFPVRVYLNERNLGSTKNFECAIHRCTGDIIFLADQDDVWREDKVESILQVFRRSEKVALVFSDAEVVDEALCTVGQRLWATVRFGSRRQKKINNGEAFSVLVHRNPVTGATMALRKKYLDIAYPFPSEWVHDAWIALLISAVAELAFTGEPLIKYRSHVGQQIGTDVGLRGQVRGAYARNAAFWLSEANNYKLARERLKDRDPISHAQHIRVLDEKVDHFIMRGEILLRSSRLWPIYVVKEALNGRYFRYSGGYRSILKDLLLKG